MVIGSERLLSEKNNMITVICPWYLNTAIVRHQLNVWNAFPDALKERTQFILIDDGSPNTIGDPRVDLNLTLARIGKDIPWNQPGARNLGAYLADTPYLLFTDIDHEITVAALTKAHEKVKDPKTVYRFARIMNGRPLYPHPCSFVISKEAFNGIGGFDEDFSGYRGHDDTLFNVVVDKYLERDWIAGALILHPNGLTPGLERDSRRNTALLRKKKEQIDDGTYTAGERLRFDWQIVFEKRRWKEDDTSDGEIAKTACIPNERHTPTAQHLKPSIKVRHTTQEVLNPIFEYASKGQYHENRMAWDTSVEWYQRALTCLPNLFGVDKKIRPLSMNGKVQVSFTPQHASRIYEALGRVMTASGRREDGLLAFRAAHALDTNNIAACKALDKIALPEAADSDFAVSKASGGPMPSADCDLKANLTLIMVTHCTGRLKKFEMLSPPSNKLVTATYGSLQEVFGDGVRACPKIMGYDLSVKPTNRDKAYTRALEMFCHQNGFELCVFPGVGLFHVLHRMMQRITTPYIFFVEHDWLFRGPSIQLPVIIEMMNSSPNIHAVRFNKRDSYLNGQDFIMCTDTANRAYPLIRTSSYSNNPSIIRAEKLINEWLPTCEKALTRVSHNLGGSAFGIEEILFKKYVHDIRIHGFDRAHSVWGTHIFGRVGDPQRVVHLGE